MCSIHCPLNFSLLVIQFLLIIFKMQLHPRLRQIVGSNLLKMRQLIKLDIRVDHNANSHINYLGNKIYIIHFFPPGLSWISYWRRIYSQGKGWRNGDYNIRS